MHREILVVYMLEPLSDGMIWPTYGEWSYINEHWQPWKRS